MRLRNQQDDSGNHLISVFLILDFLFLSKVFLSAFLVLIRVGSRGFAAQWFLVDLRQICSNRQQQKAALHWAAFSRARHQQLLEAIDLGDLLGQEFRRQWRITGKKNVLSVSQHPMQHLHHGRSAFQIG